ncbi:MAG TPA: aminopeptidase [Chitinivibrionales bacterium]|nr:aminopeptidase [Chitinivibrionales bacterium]
MNEQFRESARIALMECLGLGRQETLLVVCDPPCAEIGWMFWSVGSKRCREAVLVQISPRKQNGNEPPQPVGEWFGRFDVAVMPTSKSLSHTQARRKASEQGTRIATLPGITKDMFVRTMRTDWKKLGIITRKVAGLLSCAKAVRITSDAGTDLSFKTGGRAAKADDGRLIFKGAFGNLPAGEAYLAPLEGTAEGRIVIDGSFPLAGLCKTPLDIRVKKGKVAEVGEHLCKAELEQLFKKYGSPAKNIAEFGVGTLDTAIISGNTLEDEKVRGTCHIAFGDNASMGGWVKVPMHLDGIIKRPTIWLDEKLWMKNGILV